MPETKILPPDDLRRILKRAAGREVTWPEIDLVKDHCAAMAERVRELERQYVAPSQWRCDGCGCVERPNDGRRPDRHDSCGGMWIRQERTENA